MLKFPLIIEKEEEVTLTLFRELLVVYARNIVKPEGDYLDAHCKLEADIFVMLHEGKIAKGSKASISFNKEKVYVKLLEDENDKRRIS